MADIRIISPGRGPECNDERGKRGHRGPTGPTGPTGPCCPPPEETGIAEADEFIQDQRLDRLEDADSGEMLLGILGLNPENVSAAALNMAPAGAFTRQLNAKLVNGILPQVISAMTGAGLPIVCTIVKHGFQPGDTITINGCLGNTAANGTWYGVTILTADTFELPGAVGNGAYDTINPGTATDPSGAVHEWASFAPVFTFTNPGTAGPPSLLPPTPTFSDGFVNATVVFATGGGETYALGDSVTVTIHVSATDTLLGWPVAAVTKTYNVVA